MRRCKACCAAMGLLLMLVSPMRAEIAKDAESATHGADDAQHQMVDTYKFSSVSIVQFNLPVLSHYSYILVSGKDALVVDPSRDVAAYTDYARRSGLTIRGVFLTHSHADFVAGHRELATALEVPIYQHAGSGARYPIEGLKDSSTFRVGSAVVKALETPGHTPDSLCAAVYSDEADAAPKAILTGDTLFVGSIGRPDLLEGKMTAATLASMSYDTWFQKLAKLPDEVLVLPAHGAGSLCGAHLSDQPSTTIGEQRRSNPYLQHKGRSEFVAAVLEGLPEAPQYFTHNAAMNREGPPLLEEGAAAEQAEPGESLIQDENLRVVDIRDAKAYAAGHIPNSLNIALRGRLETWVGIMVPWGSRLVLVGNPQELKEAVQRLPRVGYKASALPFEQWTKAGLAVARNETIQPSALYAQMQSGEAPVLVDVRLPAEWMGLRIGTVVNLPLNQLGQLAGKLDPSQPVVTVCNSAYRSSMAVGVLERRGFARVASLEGGSEAWIQAGLPVYGNEAKAAPAAAPKRHVALAERISPADLKQRMLDMPGTFDLVDIRPAEAFADYNLPGSRNVEIADLLADRGYLVGAGPLVVIDRDGSLAMMVAGILSQKTQRPIQALHGGLEAYWQNEELRPAVRAVPLPAAPAAPAASPQARPAPVPAVPSAPAPAGPAVAKKKSAGC